MKPIYHTLPIVYFILLGIFMLVDDYKASGTTDFVTGFYLLLVGIQFFFKNRVAGIVTGFFIGLISVFVIFATASYLTAGFDDANNRSMITQLAVAGITFAMAVLLIVYCVKEDRVQAKP